MGEATGSNAVTVGTQTDEQLWRREEPREEPRARNRVSMGVQINESFFRLRDDDGELLPGIPNDITLDQIVPKLPWTAFHVLSSVSHCWHQAIQSHKVHDARVRSHATDELVVMKYDENNFLTLYSMTDGHSYALPCIPRVNERARISTPYPNQSRSFVNELWLGYGISNESYVSCVSLNGKIYALGGTYEHGSSRVHETVYVRDLAGQSEWIQCASMQHQRDWFGYGVKDGKIYVFGGLHLGRFLRGCEVYDPEQNSWSQIAPMESQRYAHQVASLGDELFVFGGCFFGPGWRHSRALVLEAYHPIKNKWRRVGEHPDGQVFMALGKFHVMAQNTIDVYDHQKNTWSHLQSINLGNLFLPYAIVVRNDKLLIASMADCDGDDDDDYHLFQGEGLGNKNIEIFMFRYSGSSGIITFPCTIQL